MVISSTESTTHIKVCERVNFRITSLYFLSFSIFTCTLFYYLKIHNHRRIIYDINLCEITSYPVITISISHFPLSHFLIDSFPVHCLYILGARSNSQISEKRQMSRYSCLAHQRIPHMIPMLMEHKQSIVTHVYCLTFAFADPIWELLSLPSEPGWDWVFCHTVYTYPAITIKITAFGLYLFVLPRGICFVSRYWNVGVGVYNNWAD